MRFDDACTRQHLCGQKGGFLLTHLGKVDAKALEGLPGTVEAVDDVHDAALGLLLRQCIQFSGSGRARHCRRSVETVG